MSRRHTQRQYRQRYGAGEIAPSVPISARAQAALIRRAVAYGLITPEAASMLSEPKANRDFAVAQAVDVLERLADEWL